MYGAPSSGNRKAGKNMEEHSDEIFSGKAGQQAKVLQLSASLTRRGQVRQQANQAPADEAERTDKRTVLTTAHAHLISSESHGSKDASGNNNKREQNPNAPGQLTEQNGNTSSNLFMQTALTNDP
jgi:hypothetical protein